MGEFLLVAVAGLAAAAINGVVGSGTLLTYPLLLSVGLPPVVANGTNSVGLSVGGVAAALAYREELRPRLRMLAIPTAVAMAGGALGAVLVVRLPERIFTMVVPWLILVAVLLVAFQPLIARRLQHRKHHLLHAARDLPVWTAVLGVYGGYFGAGQGVMYMAVLGLRYDEDVQQSNGAKNLMGSLANVAAAVVFIVSGMLSWKFAVALWLGSILGGYYGASFARRIPRSVLRLIVIGVGVYAAGYLFIVYY